MIEEMVGGRERRECREDNVYANIRSMEAKLNAGGRE